MKQIFLLLYIIPLTLLQGQIEHPGFFQPRERIKNTLGGVYSSNATLFFRNSPYRVRTDLTVEVCLIESNEIVHIQVGATLTIETGVQLYFDTGVGLTVKGSLWAIVSSYRISRPFCLHLNSLSTYQFTAIIGRFALSQQLCVGWFTRKDGEEKGKSTFTALFSILLLLLSTSRQPAVYLHTMRANA